MYVQKEKNLGTCLANNASLEITKTLNESHYYTAKTNNTF